MRYKQFVNSNVDLQSALTKAISCESDIDVLYSTFVKTVQLATSMCLPKPCFKGHIKPYWSTQLTNNHKSMTRARNEWVSNRREQLQSIEICKARLPTCLQRN